MPRICTASARALLARFGSVVGVVAASPAGWVAVPGIGPKRARALGETLGFAFGAGEEATKL